MYEKEKKDWQEELSPLLHELYNWIYNSQEIPKTQREIAAFTVHWEYNLKQWIIKKFNPL